MSITITPLDSSHDENPSTILIGKDILIMFRATAEVPKNTEIQKLISKKDLLTLDELLDDLRDLQLRTDEIVRNVADIVQFADYVTKDATHLEVDSLTKLFTNLKTRILEKGLEISTIENKIQMYFAEDHRMCFCSKCSNYIGIATESLPEKCKVCDEKIIKDIDKAITVRYLGTQIRNYLQGIWFQDYIAKILRIMGWEAWVECSVMGSSGTYHPMDVLGINKKQGRVLIAECKRTATGDDAFILATRFLDIQPSFGLLASFSKLNSQQGKNLLARKPGLKLLELGGKTDLQVIDNLENYISRDN